MRNLFLALVLANLAFAAWHNWFANEEWPSRMRNVDEVGIKLMREVDSSTAPSSGRAPSGDERADLRLIETRLEPSTALTSPEAKEEPTTCWSIGPFARQADATDVAAALEAAGFPSSERERVEDVWIGQWVYVDMISTQAQANEIVGEFRNAGVTEAYVIAEADNGNLVSLGVFAEPARAEQRVREARNLGYEPTLVDRTQPGRRFWIDVDASGPGTQALESKLDELDIADGVRREACLLDASDP